MSAPVLQVRSLSTHFLTRAGTLRAVDDVSFTVGQGEVLGLVGESGCGKSVTAFSALGLVDPPGRVTGGEILFKGRDLLKLDEESLRAIRGRHIAMIFQDPMMTLNPVLRISTQMIEAILAHARISRAEARERARDALGKVGIPSPEERLDAYPHEFSGGMRQRVAIAIALLHSPELVIADEPTTALDVTIQGQILAEVQKLVSMRGMAVIWISHDLAVVSNIADRIAVMYAGRLIEEGRAGRLLAHPFHPYTRGLLCSVPSRNRRGEPLAQIPGMMPSPLAVPEGCAFRPRCPRAVEACRQPQAMRQMAPGQWARCCNAHVDALEPAQ